MSETGEEIGETVSQAPEKRRPGRPLGSRNKVSREAREILAKGGRRTMASLLSLSYGTAAAVKALHAVAAGQPIQEGGATPELDHVFAAHRLIQEGQRLVVQRLVAELKAQEISGPDGEPLDGMPMVGVPSDPGRLLLSMFSAAAGARRPIETATPAPSEARETATGTVEVSNAAAESVSPAEPLNDNGAAPLIDPAELEKQEREATAAALFRRALLERAERLTSEAEA